MIQNHKPSSAKSVKHHAIEPPSLLKHLLVSTMKTGHYLATFALFAFLPLLPAQDKAHLSIDSPFGSFVEEGAPFFTQTLDARNFGANPEKTNLTPRGIIIPLGQDFFGCFDPDLLRWSLIWKANQDREYLTMDGMGPGSYRFPNRKAPPGQDSLPVPMGEPIFASAALPGWCIGKKPTANDPRERGSSDEGEIGLGPIPESIGRFSGIRLTDDGVVLEYQMGGLKVREQIKSEKGDGTASIRRILEVTGKANTTVWQSARGQGDHNPEYPNWKKWTGSGTQVTTFAKKGLTQSKANPSTPVANDLPSSPAPPAWAETIQTSITTSESSGAFVFDDLALPVPNPWKRNVRLSGFDFYSDGRAAFCTFDGDIWIAEGLTEGSDTITWSRFASGLHEPKTICIVDDEIYVSDRNGIVKLNDTDSNGEADWYENFSNIVAQTAETREFAMDMAAASSGGFYLAKGGQVGSTRGKLNGTIVKVSSDGRSYEVIATGLRQPYIGYNAETGILTSSDQQGHWKPATPIYQIEQGKYYGFQPSKFKEKAVHPAPIAPPEIWIPHFINQSGASQVWMNGKARMGPLNGDLVHIGYNRPEIFKVYLDDTHSQGAVVPVLSGFPSGILKGRINPIDGRLYLCGFEIWGTSGDRISGLFRVRPTGAPSWTPRRLEASKRGVLLTFDQKLSPELASELGRYSVDRWNYQQTHNYGSGNFKLDGEPGQEAVPVASTQLSNDGKSLFLGLVGMKPSHTLRVTYRIPVPESTQVDSAYLTIRSLPKIDLTENGFQDNTVDLNWDPSLTTSGEVIEPTAKLGKEVALLYGCVACHATGESGIPAPAPISAGAGAGAGAMVAVGPPWIGLWNSLRTFTDGSFVKNADETYLRESILDPGRRVAEGFDTEKTGVGMPSYLGVLKDHEIDSIVLYIKSLSKKRK
tara:strand:+ start:981 stop:3755 length:2775 start_codon:yes stop_codon:yes gene_type:complete